MCYDFKQWAWKGRARETAKDRPLENPQRETAKTSKPAERPRDTAQEKEKVPA
ncbi:MAG: hypothetical protein ACM3JC_03055 [Rudaea sp.]